MNSSTSENVKKESEHILVALDTSPLDDFISIIFRRIWLLVVGLIIASSCGIWYANSVTPVYQAKTTLVPVESSGSSGGGLQSLARNFSGLASLAGVSLNRRGSKLDKVIAVLESRQFTQDFIERHDLKKSLFSGKWDQEKNSWIGDEPSNWSAFRKFTALRKVLVDNKTSLITLSINWIDPETAAFWTNALVKDINLKIRNDDLKEAKQSIEFLTQQLAETQVVEMQQVLYGLIETQAQTIMLTDVRDEYVLSIIDPAYVPEKPIKPRKLLIIALFFVVGLLLSIFFILLLHLLTKRSLGQSYKN